MLGWALTFLVVALIAGVLGFTTIAGTAIGVAKILFYVFLSFLHDAGRLNDAVIVPAHVRDALRSSVAG